MKQMRLIFTPFTRTAKLQKHLCTILKMFSEAGYETTVYFTQSKGDGARYAKETAAESDLLVCCGGDGTLNEVAGGLLEVDPAVCPKLGYIPAGTCNDFASSLEIPLDAVAAAKRILKGKSTPLDIGSFHGRQFMYVASFGAFTEASYSTPQAMKNTLGHFAYVLKGVTSIKDIKPYHAKFEVNGKTYEDDYIFASVSNSTSIAGIVKLDRALVDLSDGLFEVALVKNPKNLSGLMDIAKAVLEKNLNSEYITLLHAASVTFSSDEDIPWTLDGEFDPGAGKVEILNRHHALRFAI
ncbi:MAG: YegS/Rv2252/BmrU family lipid kinase [Clostridia bacterium]|nr:YegS/Rv2252/BmrU family lipid kinase [Clostridia bacterium]